MDSKVSNPSISSCDPSPTEGQAIDEYKKEEEKSTATLPMSPTSPDHVENIPIRVDGSQGYRRLMRDFATVKDPEFLKDVIAQLLIDLDDKSKRLTQAESLNEQQSTRMADLKEENDAVKGHMKDSAFHLAQLEEGFASWQAKLIATQQEEKEMLIEDHRQEVIHYTDQVKKLEALLQEAGQQMENLRREKDELADTTAFVSGLASENEEKTLHFDTKLKRMQKIYENEKQQLHRQVIDVTKRRIAVQLEAAQLEEEYSALKARHAIDASALNKAREEIAELKRLLGEPTLDTVPRHAYSSMKSINLLDE